MSRHISLEGASNFRDFGGYPTASGRTVKWGALYRSDHLCKLTAADYEALAARSIRLVCDLRRHSELETAPTCWIGESAPEIWHAPLFADTTAPSVITRLLSDPVARRDPAQARELMVGIYRGMVTKSEVLLRYREIFTRLADRDSYPVLVHCAGGKDRTGVTCALLLSLLGVSREDVLADYLLTQEYYQGLAQLRAGGTQVIDTGGHADWTFDALVPIFSVEEAYLNTALDLVEAEHGDVATFLEQAVGVESAELERIRSYLLE